jgi:hypothetical protein
MVRDRMIEGEVEKTNGFRWRGRAVSRAEGFSDAAFAFALGVPVQLLLIAWVSWFAVRRRGDG